MPVSDGGRGKAGAGGATEGKEDGGRGGELARQVTERPADGGGWGDWGEDGGRGGLWWLLFDSSWSPCDNPVSISWSVVEDDEKSFCSSLLFGWGRAVVEEEEDMAAKPPASSSCCFLLCWTRGLGIPMCMLTLDTLSLLLFFLRNAKGMTRGVVEGEEKEGARVGEDASPSCSSAETDEIKALPVSTSSPPAPPAIERSFPPAPVSLPTSAWASWTPPSALSGVSSAVAAAGNCRCGLQAWGLSNGGFSSLLPSIKKCTVLWLWNWVEDVHFR